jgi:PAS domain S-box-containing protein
MRDIKKEQIEAGLRASEERLRLVMENVRDYAILLLDVAGRVTQWRVGAEAMFDYRAEEMLGQSAQRIFTPEDVARGEPERELRQAAAQGRAEDERWHVRRDGSRFWGSRVMTALYDEGGQLRGFAKVLRDLTERRQAEAILAERTAGLQRSNEELQQFSHIVSHDLNEPLRTMSNYVTLWAPQFQGQLDATAEENI